MQKFRHSTAGRKFGGKLAVSWTFRHPTAGVKFAWTRSAMRARGSGYRNQYSIRIHVPLSLKLVSFSPMSVPPSISTNKKLLFAPKRGGLRYVEGDYLKALEQQPLCRIPSYLNPSRCTEYAPPILHYGWAIDEDAIMKFAAEHNLVVVAGPDKTPDVSGTLFNPALVAAIAKHVGVTNTGHLWPDVAFENGEYLHIFGAGTNYTTFPTKDELAKLEAFFGGAPARWYLDLDQWRWSRFRKACTCDCHEEEHEHD
ncbi:hypothetical protein PLICRDRAFT_628411 [Plicaturopsis crispa FD-325 SS-3]|nr:hypothetical protein PLICRDRAFT_628411 [Plicaturopsis crispa FD-325 SS-3]